MKKTLHSLEDTENFAKDFLSKINSNSEGATLVGLYGNLGAGKTHITKFLAKHLGVKENIVSPTFIIMKFYEIPENNKFSNLIHIDAYRLEESQELLNLGFGNLLKDPKNLILLEWPEKVLELLPSHKKILIKHGVKDDEREVEIDMD